MNKSQRNYTVHKKELLAIVMAVRKLRHLLWGKKLFIHTGNKVWKWIKTIKEPDGTMLRWINEIMGFDPEIIIIKGQDNVVADSISRLLKDINAVDS